MTMEVKMKTAIAILFLTSGLMPQSIDDIDGSPIIQEKGEAILRHTEDTALCDPNTLLALDHGPLPYEFAKTVTVSLYDMVQSKTECTR
jgi:hypothetical protein